jgi:hypothetical protein
MVVPGRRGGRPGGQQRIGQAGQVGGGDQQPGDLRRVLLGGGTGQQVHLPQPARRPGPAVITRTGPPARSRTHAIATGADR